MLNRVFTHCVLQPNDFAPTDDRFKVVGTFNPGIAEMGDEVILLVRVVEQAVEDQPGYEPSPRFDFETGRIELDWLDERDLEFYDPRVYHQYSTGLQRLRFISYLKVVRSRDGMHVDDFDGPALMPENIYEEYGIEDPRITRIGETWYITYVGVSRHGVATCLMSTTDFRHFHRHGIIFPPENKDVLLFPEPVDGEYLAMHRPVPSIRFRPPEIWIGRSPDLIHWGRHEQLISPEATWQRSRIGGGTPPIRTDNGWLTLYHGSYRPENDPGPGMYVAGALLLDPDEPSRVIAQTAEPVMEPEHPFEEKGFVPKVVFPTGMIQRDEEFWVYYGAADEYVGVLAFDRTELLDQLEHHTPL